MMFGKKKPVFICGQCMQKFDPARVKLSEVGQMHKDVCAECGKRTYGTLCNLEIGKINIARVRGLSKTRLNFVQTYGFDPFDLTEDENAEEEN